MIVIKKLSKILLFLSGLLIVLHNLTPHFHEISSPLVKEIGDDKEDESLIDWLTDLFAVDYGEGHMECYSQSRDLAESDQYFDNLILHIGFAEPQHLITDLPPYYNPKEYFYPHKVPKDRSVAINPLRGPPCLTARFI